MYHPNNKIHTATYKFPSSLTPAFAIGFLALHSLPLGCWINRKRLLLVDCISPLNLCRSRHGGNTPGWRSCCHTQVHPFGNQEQGISSLVLRISKKLTRIVLETTLFFFCGSFLFLVNLIFLFAAFKFLLLCIFRVLRTEHFCFGFILRLRFLVPFPVLSSRAQTQPLLHWWARPRFRHRPWR